MKRGASLLGKATFVMDRGYDDNKRFLKLDSMGQDYVIRLTERRKLKPETNALKVSIIKTASPIKEKVHFCYYRLAKGVTGILSYAKEGVRLWFRTKRPTFRQLCLKLVV